MSLDERAHAELLATFQVEVAEHCQTLNRDLLALEKEPESAEKRRLLEEAFRSAHSLKGAARSVGIEPVERLAHGLEGVLSRARHAELELSPALFDLLYAAVDSLDGACDENGESLAADSEVDSLVRQLAAAEIGHPRQAPAQDVPTSTVMEPVEMGSTSVLAAQRPVARGPRAGLGGSDETLRLPVARLDQLLAQLGELVLPRLEVEEALAALADLRDWVEVWRRDWRRVRPLPRQLEREGTFAHARQLGRFLERNEANMVSLGAGLAALHARLAGPSAQFRALTDELQAEVKQFRMLPFGNLADSFERSVRDLARTLGKEARLVVVGADTELDRRVLDVMKDPLLHLLRNALDHGIESPAERQRRGKPSIGSVIVAAAQRGGTIVVEVEDDGAGLDPDLIRRIAAERQLMPLAELEALSESEVVRLIFLSGLSSRIDVSEVSGRGVGLDVVARNVEQLGGRVEVVSTPGRGTHFSVTLPLTLATTRAILLEADDALFALPTAAVERILRPERLGSVGGRLALDYEAAAVPVVALAELLDLRAGHRATDQPVRATLALIRAGAQRAALAIDRVVGEQEIVVKPLGYPLRRVRYVAGATLLGSGRVVPILNPSDLIRGALRLGTGAVTPQLIEPERRQLRVLVADDSVTTRSLERYILEAAGYEVELAGDGAEALALLRERPFDVVVSDVAMPHLDGIGLTVKLRQDSKLKDLPVILVTSLESRDDRERGLEAGADAYIVKSGFDQDHLLRTIRELT